jgi:hypothetical protein
MNQRHHSTNLKHGRSEFHQSTFNELKPYYDDLFAEFLPAMLAW